MQNPSSLLFERDFNGTPLFSSQLDLITKLLNDERTKYYVDKNDFQLYSKAQTRLKTYLSQLLSGSVSRSITEDFKRGLLIAITDRLGDSILANDLVNTILQAIQEKNTIVIKPDSRVGLTDQFSVDFNASNYVAVITSRPIDVDDPERTGLLRKYLFKDLINRLYDKDKDLKFYRFNFPIEQFGQLFWRLLKRYLQREVKNNFNHDLLESLYSKFAIKTETAIAVSQNTELTPELLSKTIDEILIHLNRNRYIMVFTNNAPVYGLPLVAFDPSDTNHIKVYAMLNSEPQKDVLYKFPDSETLLWRVFVWDTLKAKKFAGQEIPYSADIA